MLGNQTSAQPLRVSLLIGRLGLGGAEEQVAILACGLHVRDGVDTRVLVMFVGGSARGRVPGRRNTRFVHVCF
jgi:hypothetical protein